MKMFFISDIHYESWNQKHQEMEFQRRLIETLAYGYKDFWWDDNDIILILGWDFFSLYCLQELMTLNKKIANWEDIKKTKTYQELVRVVYMLESILMRFIKENEIQWEIKKIILSPGNHDFWDNQRNYSDPKTWEKLLNDSEISAKFFDITLYPKNTLNLLKHALEEVFEGVDTHIDINFNNILSLNGYSIISGSLQSPLIELFVKDGESEDDSIIKAISEKRTDSGYMWSLENEAKNWKISRAPLWEDANFIHLWGEKLIDFLDDEYNTLKKRNLEYLWEPDHHYYQYYSKMTLYFLNDVNNIIRSSQLLPEDEVLIINHHFPFYIRDYLENVFDNFTFSHKYLFPHRHWNMVDQFFNIDIRWLMWLLPKLKQKKIILLSWHTHEQYKASFDYKWKEIIVINNNLWYGPF